MIDTIEGALAGRQTLVGDRFTAADLYMVSSLSWGGRFGAPRIKESAAIQSYLASHMERPAFRRATGG